MDIPQVVPEICLVVGAAAGLLFSLFAPRRAQAWSAAVALVAIAASMITTADLILADRMLAFGRTYAIDDAALWAKEIILGAAALVVVMSPEWFRTDPRHGEYYTVLLLATLGAVMMAGAADVMALVVAVMLSSVGSYVLAAFHRSSGRAAEAGMKMFLLGGLTNAFLLFGVVLLFGLAGSTLYGSAEAVFSTEPADPLVLIGATGLITLGLAFKLGAVPAHQWVPDVAQGSPAPAAAFLTVIPKLGALVALARIFSILPETDVAWRAVAAVLAAATMTLGNLAALWQNDVRRLLGWSSVSQSGYGIMAVVAVGESELAIPALLFFLAAYAVANLAAFGVVVELRGRTDLSSYAGLGRIRPWLAAALALALLSLVGIPPLAGFFAKVALFGAVIDAGYGWLAALAVLNTVISLFYYLRVIAPIYFERTTDPVPILGRVAAFSVAASVAGVIVLGLGAQLLLGRFEDAVLLP